MKKRLLFLAAALLLAIPGLAAACSCGGYSSVCESYAAADAVFIGSVQSVEEVKQKAQDGSFDVVGQRSHVQVEKVFKGVKAAEVIFRSELSSCDAGFKEGQRWLFYAYYNKKSKTWSIEACDRSTQVDNAAEDLLYLQGLPASAAQTRISGDLQQFEDDPEKGFTRVGKLIGAKVKIRGKQKSYEVYTDKNGVYEIYGLPPGKYVVEPEIPVGLKIRFPISYGSNSDDDEETEQAAVRLTEKGCAGVSFVFSSDTKLSGRLLGADGRALPSVCLHLTPKDKEVALNRLFSCTDRQGRYEIKQIPPGEYLIIVNSYGKISSNAQFPLAYYPGVFERERATPITITAGDNLQDYDIHIPAQEATHVIQGVLLYSDGRPVVDKFVEFRADTVKEGFDGEVHTSTDAGGRFSLTVLQGLKGSLRGFMYTYSGQFVNCPQLEKILQAKGGGSLQVDSKPLALEVDADLQNVKLVFPFPYCVKAERK